MSVNRAEVCAVACAELFRDAGEIMVSPMATMVSIGARLARLTFSPDILLTDGEARLLADTPAIGVAGAIEGWMPFGRVFETLAWGRRHVVMGANQIDRYGNQNLSAFGPLQHPTRQMFGVRGAPGNTHQPRHQLLGRQPLQAGVRRFRRHRLGNRLGQGRPAEPGLPVHQRLPGGDQPRRVRLQRTRPQMRALSLHPGVEAEQVAENTSFEVHGLDDADTTRLPTEDEQKLIREVIDPKALRDKESHGMTATSRTPLTELVGIEHPVVQTGMGWVAGARLVAATSNAGGLGILASATMTLDELQTAVTKVKAATDKPFGDQHPRRRRRRERAHRPADPRRRQGGVVRAGAQARPDREAQRRRRGGDSVGRRRPSTPRRSPAGAPTR